MSFYFLKKKVEVFSSSTVLVTEAQDLYFHIKKKKKIGSSDPISVETEAKTPTDCSYQ